jgi:hypothetical protein
MIKKLTLKCILHLIKFILLNVICIYEIYVYVCIYSHTMEYYSTSKKNKIIPFIGEWMKLKIIMLSEISQDKYHVLLICAIQTLKSTNVTWL